METKTLTGTVISHRTELYNGATTTYTPEIHAVVGTVKKDKTSVDTGCFIPNHYRVNPYSIQSDNFQLKHVVAKTDWAKSGGHVWLEEEGQMGFFCLNHYLVNHYPNPPSVPGNIDQLALQKAYGKIMQNVVGGGENIGELRETLQLLRHPFKGLRDFLLSADHKNLGLLNKLIHYRKTGKWLGGGPQTGADAANAAASAWLELRYGLRPLVYSCQDIIDLVNRKVKKFDDQRILTGRSKLFDEDERKYEHYGSIRPGSWQLYQAVFTDKTRFDVYARVQYRQQFETPLADLLGLSPRFLPELAWELTRLSFVVDWWFSVGDWLAALRVKPKVTILGNTVGIKMKRKVSVDLTAISGAWIPEYVSVGRAGSYTAEHYERKVNQHLPNFPLITLHIPDLFETLDSLALIIQPLLNNLKR